MTLEQKPETPKSLWKLDWVPACGFLVRSHDREEFVNLATTRPKQSHNQDVPPAIIENMIQPA